MRIKIQLDKDAASAVRTFANLSGMFFNSALYRFRQTPDNGPTATDVE